MDISDFVDFADLEVRIVIAKNLDRAVRKSYTCILTYIVVFPNTVNVPDGMFDFGYYSLKGDFLSAILFFNIPFRINKEYEEYESKGWNDKKYMCILKEKYLKS